MPFDEDNDCYHLERSNTIMKKHRDFINKLIAKGCHPVTAENKWLKKRIW